jgi:hypothetical protein
LPDSVKGGDPAVNPEYDPATGFIKKSSLQQFFGTTNVKIAYCLLKTGLTLYYIDYNDSIPRPRELAKPEGKETWTCESPMISPEGNWVAYNCEYDVKTNESYMQRLKPGAEPILLGEKAFDPHWWVDPLDGRYFIIYARIPGVKLINADYRSPSVPMDGSLGSTVKVLLQGSPMDVPSHMGLRAYGSESIAGLPFKGGLSPDGRYLCTGQTYSYIFRFH